MAPEVVTTTTAAAELRSVEPQVWKACAGTAARVPAVGSRVYYFPQGHVEHSDSSLDLPSACARPIVLCHVASVRLLADHSDEVFLSVRLDPVHHPAFAGALLAATTPPPPPPSTPFSFPSAAAEEVGESDKPGSGFVYFAKKLTRSDANNGGGFSVPRFCADSIFPPLSYIVDTPVQTIVVRDVHGRPWEFRHIYRGTPKRHLLTTGWSRFVNEKSLVAGDSVIFMKNSAGELFVGIRRTFRGLLQYPLYSSQDVGGEKIGENKGYYKSSRNRVAATSVVEAVRSAEMNIPFEVMYYPRSGLPEFVVAEKEVETSMSVYWAPGMRVRLSVEAEDTTRINWFQGTVSYVATKDAGRWPFSPWRMLQVTWEEPGVSQIINPWQVELVSASTHIQAPLVSPSTQIQAPIHVLKRMNSDMELIDLSNFKSKKLGDAFSSFYNKTFPAGMQGARHDSTYVSSLLNIRAVSSGPILYDLYGIGNPQETKVCTELNIGSIGCIGSNSLSEGSSPPSQGSTIESGIEIFRPLACKPTKKVKKVNRGSFRLFGQTIEIENPNDDYDKQFRKADTHVPDDSYTDFESKQLLDTLEDSPQPDSSMEDLYL